MGVINEYFDDIVQQGAALLRFDSSFKEGEGEYPFGKETAECLQYFLSLAESMGFETHNYDNYAGEVIFGSGKPFAVLAHLDVVPAGNGWKYPPFDAVINDDVSDGGVEGMKVWGRGAMDDKFPAIVCLYALKALKDQGIAPKRTFKLIVGCNEESGWKCMDYYKTVAEMPEEGFTPDADFPVIYAEKGIAHIVAKFPINEAPMSALNAGAAANMVADCATAILTRKAAEGLVYYENPVINTRLSYDNTTNILRADGKSAHASCPTDGANALQALLYFLGTINEDCKAAYEKLFDDCQGLKTLCDETGYLTMSPDMASYKNGELSVTVDIRYPATLSFEKVLEKINAWGVEYEIKNHQAALFNDKNSDLIQTLVKVYNDVTGENAQPIAIGGGTYARVLKKGCAFGPAVKGEENTLHQPNEYVTFERIRLMSEIYYNALKEIATQPQKIRIATVKLGWKMKE